MDRRTIRTYSTKISDIKRERHVIDASGQTLGRLSTQIAGLLMGKHKPIFTPNVDAGDFVIVTNAAKVKVTGTKASQKLYQRHSGYPGGFKEVRMDALMASKPERVIEHAVKGMLPHTFLSAKMKRRLTVYAGEAPKAKAAQTKTEAVNGKVEA